MKVDVIFYSNKRKTPPCGYVYRPHFIVKGGNEYLGVQFDNFDCFPFGTHICCNVKLLYDGVNYSKLTANTQFFIMEVANVVGEGMVKKC